MAITDREADNEEFLTPEQAAKVLKCSVYTVIRRCKAGKLPAINLGSEKESMWRILFRELQVQAESNIKKRTGIPLDLHPKENYIAPLLDSGKSNSRNNQ